MVPKIKKWRPDSIKNRSKMEPRGGKNRIGARKMTQDSARQLPRAAMVAQTRLSRTAGVPKWRPKSTKIDEKNDWKIDDFLNRSSFRFFFDFRSKNAPRKWKFRRKSDPKIHVKENGGKYKKCNPSASKKLFFEIATWLNRLKID